MPHTHIFTCKHSLDRTICARGNGPIRIGHTHHLTVDTNTAAEAVDVLHTCTGEAGGMCVEAQHPTDGAPMLSNHCIDLTQQRRRPLRKGYDESTSKGRTGQEEHMANTTYCQQTVGQLHTNILLDNVPKDVGEHVHQPGKRRVLH